MNHYYRMDGHHFIVPHSEAMQRLWLYYLREERILKLKPRLEPLL